MIEFFPTHQIFLQIGDLRITWYAVCIITGALIAYVISGHNFKKIKYPAFYIDDLFFGVLVTGILGARLWFCIFYDLGYFIQNPLEIIAIWDGGLAIQGGFIAALGYGLYYAHKQNIDFLRAADQIVPSVLLAQGIGRWGNFFNQECYGFEVSPSYFDGALSFLKEGMHIGGTYYEPMFFYESVLCIIGFFVIGFLLKKFQNKRGDLVWAYLMWYGVIRFFIEGHRQDSLMLGPIRMAQLTSIIYLVIGLLGFFGVLDKLFFKKKKPTILFDLDGTLLDTEKGIIETYRYLFIKYNRREKFTKEVELEVLGPSLQDIFSKYFSDLDMDNLLKEYRDYNRQIFKECNKPMEHVETTLKILKDEGYKIGIVSTKMKETVLEDLKVFDLDGYIDDIVGADEVKKQKPDPEGINKILLKNKWTRDQLIYVGDSVTDIEAGKASGAYTIGYIFNKARIDDLKEANANNYIDDLDKILDIVKEKHNFTFDLS